MASTHQQEVWTGLGTLGYTINVAGFYSVRSKSTIPTITNGGGVCDLVTVIKKNSSTLLTSATGASGCSLSGISCVVGDVINVVYSSDLAVDDYPYINKIKSEVTFFQGT